MTYKMGSVWMKRFLDEKKQNQGWKSVETEKDMFVIFKPNGNVFALYEKQNGLLHTTANIKDIQW